MGVSSVDRGHKAPRFPRKTANHGVVVAGGVVAGGVVAGGVVAGGVVAAGGVAGSVVVLGAMASFGA